jgi:hypothetical protein
MGLPSVITAGGLVFDDVTSLSGSTTVMYADSPQLDVAGRPSLRFSQEKTKAGIIRTLVSLQIPQLAASGDKYSGFIKADIVLNRSELIGVSESLVAYDVLHDILALTSTAIPVLAKGSL